MFNTAFPLVRGASRIQARSFLRPSIRNARDVIASAARVRQEKGWKGSQQSHKSNGHGQRDNRHLPLRSRVVGGFSILAAAVSLNTLQKPPRPDYAFRDPSGWKYLDDDDPIWLDYIMRLRRAIDSNSIEDARIAHFDFTRLQLEFCIHGDVIDQGSLPSDIVFGPGQYVKKEDTRVFWMPSPILGKMPILCLSVHCDLRNEGRDAAFLDSVLGTEMSARLLEKFKEENGTHIFIHVIFPGAQFSVGLPRDILERHQSLLAIQE